MKNITNETQNPHASNSSVYRFLDQALSSLETRHQSEELDCTQTLNLSLHKKAILATVGKLHIATARAYTDDNIKKHLYSMANLIWNISCFPASATS